MEWQYLNFKVIEPYPLCIEMCRGDFYEIFYETADLEFLFPDGSGAWVDRYGESDLFHGGNPALGWHKPCDSGCNGLSGNPWGFSALRDHRLWSVGRYETDRIFVQKREKEERGGKTDRVSFRFFCVFLHMDKCWHCVYNKAISKTSLAGSAKKSRF